MLTKQRKIDCLEMAKYGRSMMVSTAERKEIMLGDDMPFFFCKGQAHVPTFKNMGGGVWELTCPRRDTVAKKEAPHGRD